MGIVAYMALFASVGVIFIFVNLLLGSFLRPQDPVPEKMEIYECGEPSIGSSFVQFDLRFYVVALLFIIFDVEVALFFPWAVIFGKSNNLADPAVAVVEQADSGLVMTPVASSLLQEMGVENPQAPTRVPASLRESIASQFGATAANSPITGKAEAAAVVQGASKQFAWLTLLDIAVFFAVLLVGFAYVWKRGDLNWVRAIGRERAVDRQRSARNASAQQQYISA